MNGSNRRTFFKTAGVGAAAVGAAALVPGAVSASTSGRSPDRVAEPIATLPANASGSIVAYVHDVANGEVSVMVEGREVTVTDHQLVAKLATALHSSRDV
jgi:anti-sigma-K factor RskA